MTVTLRLGQRVARGTGRPSRPQRKGSHWGMGGARTDGAVPRDRTRWE